MEAFYVGLEVDGCDVTKFVEEVLDKDLDGVIFLFYFVDVVSFQVNFVDGIAGKLFLRARWRL
jgi:hypothetical protein